MLDNFRREHPGQEMSDEQLRVLTKDLKNELVPEEDVANHRKKINLLENKLKNIVVRQINKTREERNKQTIAEAVAAIVAKNREDKNRRSKKVEKYVKREFEAAAAQNMAENLPLTEDGGSKDGIDILYYRVIVKMKRLLKVLTGHSTAIDSLERRLLEIQESKKERKKKQRSETNAGFADDITSFHNPEDGGPSDLMQLPEQEYDDAGLEDFVEPEIPPEYKDDIDGIVSEGQMEREIMMD